MWSFSAPETISEAEAEPLLIIIIKGFPLMPSPFLEKNLLVSVIFLPLVETISPLSKKKSVMLIACVSNPPGLFLRSRMYPLNLLFFSKVFIFFDNCSLLFH